MPEHVTVAVEDLTPGGTVDSDIFSQDMSLLVASGVTLTMGIISSFKRRGITHVQVSANSEMAQLAVPAARPTAPPPAPVAPSATETEQDRFEHLLERTAEVYETHGLEQAIPAEALENATDQMEEFFCEIELGKEVQMDAIREMSNQLVTVFTARANLAVKLLDLDRFDRYTYRHSINVGMLYMLIASEWVDDQETLEDLVFGAMLHDIGKAKVGAEIINKPGKLDATEWNKMQNHPVWSAEMLEAAGASPVAVAIARSHHEKLDGNGYPDKLKGDQLDRFVLLAAICDVYDALTTKRSYKSKMDFGRAMDIILQGCGTHFHPATANEFIRRVGRYPVGCFVKLSSNEVAVVLRVNENAISRPVVSRVLNSDGSERAEGEELDLSHRSDLFITELVISKEEPEKK